MVVAIELLCAFHALRFRQPLRPGESVRNFIALIRAQGIEPYEDDRVLVDDMQTLRALLDNPEAMSRVME